MLEIIIALAVAPLLYWFVTRHVAIRKRETLSSAQEPERAYHPVKIHGHRIVGASAMWPMKASEESQIRTLHNDRTNAFVMGALMGASTSDSSCDCSSSDSSSSCGSGDG